MISQSQKRSFHSSFNELLKNNVSETGKVNYNGFINNKKELDAYTSMLIEHPPKDEWTNKEKLSYWINAYNAFTIKMIIKNYPIKSITDLHGGNPWGVKWISINGIQLSLNEIENDIIRPTFKDPRIHFALNCAAKSCPKLLNEAYSSAQLEKQLDQQTKQFINEHIVMNKKSIELSKIFQWYSTDFENTIEFLNKYSDIKIMSNAKINYQEYDWSLNN